MTLRTLVALLLSGVAAVASAQNYPTKYIRIITTEAAGAADIAARLIAPGLAATFGQQVVIDNRSGAGSVSSIESVARAAPDGYILLLHGSPVWLMPFMRSNVPWDPMKDFSTVTLAVTLPNILVVHPSLPIASVKDLIAMTRAKPGEVNYASGSTGASNHLAAELFNAIANVKTVRVPYKGGGPAVLGLLSAQVQFMFATAASVSPHVKSGRLKAIAVTSPAPSALFPELPTVSATGLPGFSAETLYGLFAPAKTPPNIVQLVNQEVVRVLHKPEVKERLFNAGIEVAATSAEEFGAILKADMAKWGKVIQDAGIRDE